MDDRRPVWPWIITAAIGLPVTYVVSFGPACWISNRLEHGTTWVSTTYRPVIWLGNRLPSETALISRYAGLGARPNSTPDFRHDELSWWDVIESGSVSFEAIISCSVGEPDDGLSRENGIDPSKSRPEDSPRLD